MDKKSSESSFSEVEHTDEDLVSPDLTVESEASSPTSDTIMSPYEEPVDPIMEQEGSHDDFIPPILLEPILVEDFNEEPNPSSSGRLALQDPEGVPNLGAIPKGRIRQPDEECITDARQEDYTTDDEFEPPLIYNVDDQEDSIQVVDEETVLIRRSGGHGFWFKFLDWASVYCVWIERSEMCFFAQNCLLICSFLSVAIVVYARYLTERNANALSIGLLAGFSAVFSLVITLLQICRRHRIRYHSRRRS